MVLECEFSLEQFDREITRLENLRMTIKSGEEEYTNIVRYDGDSYNYPAYITIDGFGHACFLQVLSLQVINWDGTSGQI